MQKKSNVTSRIGNWFLCSHNLSVDCIIVRFCLVIDIKKGYTTDKGNILVKWCGTIQEEEWERKM